MKLLFILPLVMCLAWTVYLRLNDYSLRQGLKGFGYILAFNGFIAAFFVVMMFVTH